MADSNALSHAQLVLKSIQDASQRATQAFHSAHPEISDTFRALKSLRESLATLPAPRPANDKWITPDRPPSPREPSSPRPATPPPSPIDAAMQDTQNKIALADQREAHLQQLLQCQQELAEKQQRVATLEHKLQAAGRPVRFCQHCHHPLYIHLPDGALEPCTRNNRFNCGYDSEGRLVGNLECIKSRNAAKSRRKYTTRKTRDQAGKTAPELYEINGIARPQ
jgi:hypothetical protein